MTTGITQHVAIDESMIKMLSKFCPWLQYMPKKPIKWGAYCSSPCHPYTYTHATTHTQSLTHTVHTSTGIKVFCLVLSTGYLYNWHVYRAKADPLRGPDYMYRLIFDTLLVGTIWNFANVVVFFDAAFTSIRLVRDLHDKRGIYSVGPINTSKPSKGGGPHTWPFQKFNNTATKYLSRGWDRVAFTKLDGGWLQVRVHVYWAYPVVYVFVLSVCVLHVRGCRR